MTRSSLVGAHVPCLCIAVRLVPKDYLSVVGLPAMRSGAGERHGLLAREVSGS